MTSSSISIIIIDDEPLARKGMKEYISQIPFLNLTGEYDNPVSAIDKLKSEETQAILLDIEMPKISGLNFLKTLSHPPPVIFTTAYPQYAVDGYEVNALDYLVKPISFERFFKAVSKLRDYYDTKHINADANYFFIKEDQKIVRLLIDEITYVEGMENYVIIHTSTQKHISYLTLKSVEEFLDPEKFMRVHKSFLVALNKIESIEGNTIRIHQHQIPIGRSVKEQVMSELLKGRFLKR